MRGARRKIFLSLSTVAAILLLVAATPARPVPGEDIFRDDFSSGKLDAWQFPFPEDWVINQEGPLYFLHMLRNREPLIPRRPQQFTRIKGINAGSFTLDVRVRRIDRSLLIAFNYVDNIHFYYTHLSVDSGLQVNVHNGIFKVDGAPRVRIAGLDAPPALPDKNWHKIRVQRDVRTGSIEVFVDADAQPRFSVIDTTFKCGQVGLGSFDETGDFAEVKLSSKDGGCRP
jgi:hypothetical protein